MKKPIIPKCAHVKQWAIHKVPGAMPAIVCVNCLEKVPVDKARRRIIRYDVPTLVVVFPVDFRKKGSRRDRFEMEYRETGGQP